MRWQGGEGWGDIPDVDAEADGGRRKMMMIDLELATRILMQGGCDRRNEVDEMREYFATFDGDDKGYVTLEDLRRVRDEVGKAESEMTDAAGGPAGGGVLMLTHYCHRRAARITSSPEIIFNLWLLFC